MSFYVTTTSREFTFLLTIMIRLLNLCCLNKWGHKTLNKKKESVKKEKKLYKWSTKFYLSRLKIILTYRKEFLQEYLIQLIDQLNHVWTISLYVELRISNINNFMDFPKKKLRMSWFKNCSKILIKFLMKNIKTSLWEWSKTSMMDMLFLYEVVIWKSTILILW